MSEGKRPGGLTALAVFNFIFGAFNALGVIGLVTVVTVLGMIDAGKDVPPELQDLADAMQEQVRWVIYIALVIAAANAFLLIASGVGYLKQKKVMGRMFGNTYALLAIIGALIGAFMTKSEAGGGFNLGTIIGLIYPLLTLMLLNTTFKEDFVR